MKSQVRVLGIDDSPFKFKDRNALVIGALVRVPNYLEGVLKTDVEVDGTDSTEKLVRMISKSRYRDQVKAVMIDGIALAGFNIIDIELLHSSLNVPILTVTRDKPDFDKMRTALRKHFADWEERFNMITRFPVRPVHTEHKPVYASGIGADWDELERFVRMSTVRGAVPEPIRIAHLIATAIVRGESYGRS